MIHQKIETGQIHYQPIPQFAEVTQTCADGSTNNTFTDVNMTMGYLMDLAHITYGESAGKEPNKMAHLMRNREIEFGRLIAKTRQTAIGMDPETGEKIYPTSENSTLLRFNEQYGFSDYLLFVHMPYDETAVENFKQTLRGTGVQVDGGVQNQNYKRFFDLKDNPRSLYNEIPQTQSIIKAIFDARLDKTQDEHPNHEGWRGENGQNVPRNEI